MPQLNPEFFVSQLFWLVVTFSFLFVFLWRVSLPRISNVLEKRERKITEDLTAAKELQAEASQIQEEIENGLFDFLGLKLFMYCKQFSIPSDIMSSR